MLGPLVKSILKETVEKLPEDFVMKSDSVPNYLIKQGVKPEELKFAELGLPKGTVTKADLKKAEELRGGTIDREPSVYKHYDEVTLRGEEGNPTYTEMVYNFDPAEGQKRKLIDSVDTEIAQYEAGARSDEETAAFFEKAKQARRELPEGYVSSHFEHKPNYLMHARTVDQDINGTPTRTILELQSDLHQQGRQYGYAESGKPALPIDKYEDVIDAINNDMTEHAAELAKELGYTGDLEDWSSIAQWAIEATSTKAPDAPFKSNWLRKLMEFEVARAQEDGFTQVAIPISGKSTKSLIRGEGVQKWYETTVKQTAEKLAKATGGTVEYVKKTTVDPAEVEEKIANFRRVAEDDKARENLYATLSTSDPAEVAAAHARIDEQLKQDIEWVKQQYASNSADMLVIKPGPKGFTLYAGGGATAIAVANAMQEGYNDEEIRSFLKEKGLADDEIEAAVTQGSKAKQAIDQGYSLEEVQAFVDGKEPKLEPTAKTQPAMDSWQGANASKVAEAYKQSYVEGTASGPESLVEAYGAGPKALQARRDDAYKKLTKQEAISARDLVTSMQVLNPALVSLTDRVQGFAGDKLKQAQVMRAEEESRNKIIAMAKDHGVELEMQDGEYYAKMEDGRYARVTPDLWDSLISAKGEAAGGVAGALAGARLGAMATPAPHPLAKLAGSAVGAAIGAAAGSQVDYLYNAIKLSEDMNAQVAANKALTAAELSIVGDTLAYPIAKLGSAGVKQLLKAKRFLTEGNSEGAYQALKDTMLISDVEAQQLVDKLGKVAAVPGQTMEEQRIAATALTRPGAQSLVHAAIAADPKASQAVIQSIDKRAQDLLTTSKELTTVDTAKLLRDDLDNYVNDVKQFYGDVKGVVNSARPISFDYDKLAVEPVLQRLEKNIQDPATLERFLSKARAIRETSDSRTFPDLLELRHQVNDFLYNKRIAAPKDREALREVIGRIDGTIKAAAKMALPNGEEWLKSWAVANAKYAQMMRTRENVLAKALQSPQLTEAEIGNRLVKHMQTVDGTLEEVLSKLPQNARKRAEGAVVDTLANKFTAGTEGGLRATNFPMLAKELDKMVFTTPEARQFKKAVQQLADVFTNDTALARASGNVVFTKPQGFLADDVVSKFKYQAAQSVFQEAQKYMPTERGRGLALIDKVAKLLENPLHAKTTKELMKDASPELSEQVTQLQRATAAARAAGRDPGAAKVNLYGSGKILSTKGSGEAQQIPLHRIATAEQLRDIAEAEGIAISNTKALDRALKDRGFTAVMQGSDKARKL